MMRPRIARAAALLAASALAIAPPAAQAAIAQAAVQAARTNCPDAATLQAARIVEFQTMMMGVTVRCKHVGVAISDHLDQMTTARRTMFTGANERVASFLRGLGTGAAAAPVALAATATSAPATAKAPLARTRARAARTGEASTGQPAQAATSAASAPARPAARPSARVSRRIDPFDRYLTMIGNQYGAGMTTPRRCRAFDAIVMSLADKTNTDRLLTMVSGSLVQATLLEAVVNCPKGK